MRLRLHPSSFLTLLLSFACSSGPETDTAEDASTIIDSGGPTDACGICREDAGLTPNDSGVAYDAGQTPAPELSDTFDDGPLDSAWTLLEANAGTAVVENGALAMTVTRDALWFNMRRSALLYKTVSGNFKVSARVRARRASNTELPPDRNIHLGGLMARDPMGTDQGGTENYVFIVAGRDQNDLSVEIKSTTNSVSSFDGPTWPSGDADLRLCRVGSVFRMYKRLTTDTAWTLAGMYTRSDLPQTLQVGANAYAQGQTGNPPDLRVTFDALEFGTVASESDCGN